MIAVTGATGQLGRLVIRSLLERVPPRQIIAAARDPNKGADLAALGVQVRHADYTRPDSLKSAFAGADKVLLISSSDIGGRAPHHRAAIDALRSSGVELVAYTSLLHADMSPLGLAVEHRETEAMLKDSGLPVVLLRNGWYTENYTASIAAAPKHGAVIGSAGSGQISSAARADYAEAAAAVLLASDQVGQVHELAGDASYTLSDLAAEIARQTGTPVAYTDLSAAQHKAALLGMGLPEPVADLLVDFDQCTAKGALFDEGRQLSRLIGRPTTPMSKTVAAVLTS